MTSREFQERLTRRARHAGVPISPAAAARLETYFRLLAIWNEKINLTALPLTDAPPDTIDRLLIEPLIAATHVGADVTRMLDIGSGGGSPAVPMAVALPQVRVDMVEAKTRKAVFLREAGRALELRGQVFAARAEELVDRPDMREAYDLVTIRAVRTDARFLRQAQAFVRPGGALFLFRSADVQRTQFPHATALSWSAAYPLIDAGQGRLVVLRKGSGALT